MSRAAMSGSVRGSRSPKSISREGGGRVLGDLSDAGLWLSPRTTIAVSVSESPASSGLSKQPTERSCAMLLIARWIGVSDLL